MKKITVGAIIALGVLLSWLFVADQGFDRSPRVSDNEIVDQSTNINGAMQLTSTAFENNELIPEKYTCDGENINPPLLISDVPEQSRALVLLMHDPDVPTSIRDDGNWDHWLVWNMSPDITEIPEDTEPQGVIGENTGGESAYGGPCPPDQEHRYFFKLYALDSELNLPSEGTTRKDIERAMEGHILEQVELVGRYDRQ